MKKYTRRIQTEKLIRIFFENAEKKIFSPTELIEIIQNNRDNWALAPTATIKKLIERFIANEILRVVEIKLDKEDSSNKRNVSSSEERMEVFIKEQVITRYVYGEASAFDIAVSIYNKSYLSHYTAIFLHGLTTQVPKAIYTTHEQSAKPNRNNTLSQQAIDHAFSQPQRRAETKAIIGDYTIILLNGMYTNRLGVNSFTPPYTNLERTLIDITVRPNYAGGAFMVLEAYRKALEQQLSINKLVAILKNISFIYPYHQAIGFYLETAGYQGKHLSFLKSLPMDFDFYLDYQIIDPGYSPEWRIYYPKGMELI